MAGRLIVDSPTIGTSVPGTPMGMLPNKQKSKGNSAINYSRPKVYRDQDEPIRRSGNNVKAISAFHEPDRHPYPKEPRFSIDEDADERNDSVNSLGSRSVGSSDLAWDEERGELVSKKNKVPQFSTEQHMRVRQPASRPPASRNDSSSTSTTTTSISRPPTRDSAGGPSKIPLKGILKKTEVTVQTTTATSSETGGEDDGSHHTVSENGSSTSSGGQWTSSEYDTSSLSEKEIAKLEKKGINPALYAEMNAARGGKRRFGALTGNSFVG